MRVRNHANPIGSDWIHLQDRVHHRAWILSEILQKSTDHRLSPNRQPSHGPHLNRILCHRGRNPLCIPSVIRILKLQKYRFNLRSHIRANGLRLLAKQRQR